MKSEEIFPEYAYSLPEELIAHEPTEKRDDSRLFIYDTKADTITFDVFKNIGRYLPQPSLMVLNETKVLPARLMATTESNKNTELLFLLNEETGEEGVVFALSPVPLKAGETLGTHGLSLTVLNQVDGKYRIKVPTINLLKSHLEQYGCMPVPRYIQPKLDANHLQERYQTIFAKDGSSVAAPTASLHFTHEVFALLEARGIAFAKLKLDVGLGTFLPVWQEHLDANELHAEPYVIPHKTAYAIAHAKESGVPVIAVGTTVVRTIESAFKTIIEAQNSGSDIKSSTKLFIRPGYEFRLVDHMVTNFHVPQSSLMSLVDAFLIHKGSKRRITDLYKTAIDAKFRFYSFGDSMLIL